MAELIRLFEFALVLFHVLGPWGTAILVGILATAVVVVACFGERLLEMLIEGHARALAQVMTDAGVTIHSIRRAPEPDESVWRAGNDADDDAFADDLAASDMPEGEFEWYHIDMTITPRTFEEGIATTWEPAMVHLVKNDGRVHQPLEITVDCILAQVEIWENDRFTPFEHGGVQGPARIRLYAGAIPGTSDVCLSYLGTKFAELRLPTSVRTQSQNGFSPNHPHVSSNATETAGF